MTDASPNPVDLHVGARVRTRRKFLGLSQSDLADGIGLTFQQVQKYERGTNRISASKLHETARILKTSVGYFFEGYGASEAVDGLPVDDNEYHVHEFLMTAEGIELAQAFPRVRNPKHRRRLLDLVRALGETVDSGE